MSRPLFINQFPGITHNYQREGEYNLWFTLITPNERLRQDILRGEDGHFFPSRSALGGT